MKKVLASLTLLSFLAVTGCNSPSTDFQQNYESYTSFSKNKVSAKSDWYENLNPQLQAYYAEAKGKTGAELFDALHDIISEGNKIQGYGESKSFMYAVADNTTVGGKTGLFDAYSDIFVPGSGGNGGAYTEKGDQNKDGVPNDFINCEHTWPQSFFNKSMPMVADIHHLQSTMSIPNNRRGHLPFGEVNSNVIYTTNSGSKLGSESSLLKNSISKAETTKIFNMLDSKDEKIQEQGEKLLSKSGGGGLIFEPWDKQKGNTARCMLYFYTRYHDQNIRGGDFQKNEFWASKVSTFINWSEKVDPVNEEDMKRNDVVFGKQGNRNPFIDIPNLASIIGENVLKSK
jgi:endonuclease I